MAFALNLHTVRDDSEQAFHTQLQEYCIGRARLCAEAQLPCGHERRGQDQCARCHSLPQSGQERHHEHGLAGHHAWPRPDGTGGQLRARGRHARVYPLRSEARTEEGAEAGQESLPATGRAHRTDTHRNGIARRPVAHSRRQRGAQAVYGHHHLTVQPRVSGRAHPLQQGPAAAQCPAQAGRGARR